MTRYVFQKMCRPLPLLGELQAAALTPGSVDCPPGATTTAVELPPEQFDAAATVVAAHDPVAIDAAIVVDNQQFAADVAGLKQYQGLAAPTLAQTAAAVKAQTRILRRVIQELR